MAKKSEGNIDPSSVLAALKKQSYSPVYFLHGDEPYYIDKITDYAEKNLLTEEERDFNLKVLYGGECNAAQVAGECKQFPVMAARRVVIIKEAQLLKDIDKLENYFEKPSSETSVFFAFKGKSPDKRKKSTKMLEQNAVMVESKKMYDDKLPGWIEGICKEFKRGIDPKAAVLTAEYLGNDLNKIENEIEKICINVAEGKVIGIDDIQKNISVSKDYNVFELQKALGRRDILVCNRIINYFESNPKAHPFPPLISQLFSFFVKLMLVQRTEDKTKLASVLKVNPFFVKDYSSAAANYPPLKLVEIISILREYDLKGKGYNSNADAGALMKELIFRILH